MYNSHPRIMFRFKRLVIIWRRQWEGGGGIRLKLEVLGQGSRRVLDLAGQGGWEILKIRQFSWTSYVYRPLRGSRHRH